MMKLVHAAGAGMGHPFMVTLVNSLADVGIATLLFNFPFIENKKRRVDTHRPTITFFCASKRTIFILFIRDTPLGQKKFLLLQHNHIKIFT